MTTVVAATVVAGVASAGEVGGDAERAAAFVVSLAVDVAILLAVFRVAIPNGPSVREALPGAIVAAVGLLVLQSVGGWYVDATIRDASETYGVFALVIGMLSWLWLGAQLLLVAAEVNAVLARRLWPRSFAGDLTPADMEVLRRAAEAEQRDERQRIAVTFKG